MGRSYPEAKRFRQTQPRNIWWQSRDDKQRDQITLQRQDWYLDNWARCSTNDQVGLTRLQHLCGHHRCHCHDCCILPSLNCHKPEHQSGDMGVWSATLNGHHKSSRDPHIHVRSFCGGYQCFYLWSAQWFCNIVACHVIALHDPWVPNRDRFPVDSSSDDVIYCSAHNIYRRVHPNQTSEQEVDRHSAQSRKLRLWKNDLTE